MELYIIIGLLVAQVGFEIYRAFLGLNLESKKQHFKNKLRGTRTLIWDLQFKVFKTREIRESIRQEYDYMLARCESLKTQIEQFPKEKDPSEKTRLADQLTLAERDTQRFLQQMKQLDLEVEGAKPTVENPEGHDGITMQIDSLRELETMLADYVKEL